VIRGLSETRAPVQVGGLVILIENKVVDRDEDVEATITEEVKVAHGTRRVELVGERIGGLSSGLGPLDDMGEGTIAEQTIS